MAINVSFRFVSCAQLPDGTIYVKLERDNPRFPLGQWAVDESHPCNSEAEVVLVNRTPKAKDWRLLNRQLLANPKLVADEGKAPPPVRRYRL